MTTQTHSATNIVKKTRTTQKALSSADSDCNTHLAQLPAARYFDVCRLLCFHPRSVLNLRRLSS